MAKKLDKFLIKKNMIPKLTVGAVHSDQRGLLRHNNDFDALSIRRFYVIEDQKVDFIRGWQGHKIEQRWFSAMKGSFKIRLIAVDNWEKPSIDLECLEYVLTAEKLDVLHVPAGYISSIQFLEEEGVLLVMSDYLLGEIQDEYRFDLDCFRI